MHPKVVFYGGYGRVFGDGRGPIKSEGNGFKSGDIVKVVVSLGKGEISWSVNGKNEVKYCMKLIKEEKIKWVPFITMFNYKDQVEWLD